MVVMLIIINIYELVLKYNQSDGVDDFKAF